MKNKHTIRILSGVLMSVIINFILVLAIFDFCPEFVFESVPFVTALLIIAVLIREKSLKSVFGAWGIIFLANVLMELIILASGVTNYFYFKVNPGAPEIDMGVGILMAGLYIYEFQGTLLGFGFIIFKVLITKLKERAERQ